MTKIETHLQRLLFYCPKHCSIVLSCVMDSFLLDLDLSNLLRYWALLPSISDEKNGQLFYVMLGGWGGGEESPF